MITKPRGMTAAVTTTGIATILTGSLMLAHPDASASVGPNASSGGQAPALHLTAYSNRLSHHIKLQEAKARRIHQREERRARRHRAAQAAAQSSQPTSAVPSGSPQQIAATMVAQHGWSSSEFSCLDELWSRESGWNVHAENPTSGAYGIPQALPGSKMATAGSDWENDAATQIRWGLGYIAEAYGTPCAALEHSNETGYY